MFKAHGEIISWDLPVGIRVQYQQILDALVAAGLETKFAKVLKPRTAFGRCLKNLNDQRIIRVLDENPAIAKFQFTSESKIGDRLHYAYEAVLTLDKLTGQITCDERPDMAATAQAAIDSETTVRYYADISKLVNMIFAKKADLFSVRAAGGCYFVPAIFGDFLNQIDTFFAHLMSKSCLKRFPIPAGTPQGDRSVKDSVNDGIQEVIDQHIKMIEAFDDSTRDSTIEKMVERINTSRFKAEAYAEFLGDCKERIEDSLREARVKLRAKIADLGKTTGVPEPMCA